MRRAACLALPALVLYLSLASSVRAQAPTLDEFTITNDPGKAMLRREGTGLRMASFPWLPDSLANTLPRLWSAESAFAVGGDFEFSADYDVRRFGDKGVPPAGEGNAELSTSQWSLGGFFGINVGFRPKERDCFNILRVEFTEKGAHYNIVVLPRKSKQGRIGMKRQGSEMIFLAADGPGASFEELLRYPCTPTDCPRLRLSAFHGQAKSPVPLDVLFNNFTMKSDRVLRGAEIQRRPRVGAPLPSLPVKIDYAGSMTKLLGDFSNANSNSEVFRPEGGAIRVKPPVEAVYRKDGMAHHYRATRDMALAGDLECSFRFEVLKLGPIGQNGYGSVSLGLSLETNSPLGSFSVGRGFSREEGHRYTLTRFTQTPKGPSYDTQSVKTSAMSGEIGIRRVGAEATVFAKEADGVEKILWRIPIATGPIRGLRLAADQGGSVTNALDASITGLVIQAEKIDRPDRIDVGKPVGVQANAQPVVLDAAPRAASRKWVYLGVGAGLLGLLCLASILLSKRRASPQP